MGQQYFDASLIGLSATPDNRAYGFFKKNVVSDYSHEKAVADGVNVGNEIYLIETVELKAVTATEKKEWPEGYFDLLGKWEGAPLQRPLQPPQEVRLKFK